MKRSIYPGMELELEPALFYSWKKRWFSESGDANLFADVQLSWGQERTTKLLSAR
jgi:hypothetical protein